MQETTGTLLVLLVPQVIVVQLLPAFAVCGVHEGTGTLGRVFVLQPVPTQPLPALGGSTTQVPCCTGVLVTMVWQSVR